uniref:Uncharacterized protein n=1 Tax=Picea sitchensis TaxID=3332 RepID=A9NMG0_PICSI|nr:unknown [Picea sitchensis]
MYKTSCCYWSPSQGLGSLPFPDLEMDSSASHTKAEEDTSLPVIYIYLW